MIIIKIKKIINLEIINIENNKVYYPAIYII